MFSLRKCDIIFSMKMPVFRALLVLTFIPLLFFACKGKDKVVTEHQAEPPEVNKESPPPVEETLKKEKTNHKPRIESIDVVPSYPRIGDVLKATVIGRDEDGDEITYRYKWSKGGEVLSESEMLEISSSIFRRGDEIVLEVVPNDGIEDGDSGFVHLIINNSPPEIISSPQEIRIEKRVVTYHVRAIDKDGDKLTYHLLSSPPGMTIDEDTGFIRWNIPAQFSGRVSVEISVTDGSGGEAFQRFDVNITTTSGKI